MSDHPHHDHLHTHEDEAEPADYRTWVKAQRLSKDTYLKRSAQSPIPRKTARRSAGCTTTPSTRPFASRRFSIRRARASKPGLDREM